MKRFLLLALLALSLIPLATSSSQARLAPGDFEVYNVTMISYGLKNVTNASYVMVPVRVTYAFYFINVTRAFNNGTIFINFTEYVWKTEFYNLTTGALVNTTYVYRYFNITTLDNATAPGLMYYISPKILGKEYIKRGLGSNPSMWLVSESNGTYIYEWYAEGQGVKLEFIIYVNASNGVVYKAESLQYSLAYGGALVFNATYVLWKSNLVNPNATPPAFHGYEPYHLAKVTIVPVRLIIAGIVGTGIIAILIILLFWYRRR